MKGEFCELQFDFSNYKTMRTFKDLLFKIRFV